jgi:hypothetical protein
MRRGKVSDVASARPPVMSGAAESKIDLKELARLASKAIAPIATTLGLSEPEFTKILYRVDVTEILHMMNVEYGGGKHKHVAPAGNLSRGEQNLVSALLKGIFAPPDTGAQNEDIAKKQSDDRTNEPISRQIEGNVPNARKRNELLKSWLIAEGFINADERAPIVARLRAVVDRVKQKKSHPKARKKSGAVLPKLPKGLAWPKETYSDACDRENVVQYLERVWRPLIEAGFAHRRVVAMLDPSVIMGIKNYTRRNPSTGERRQIPKHLRFVTRREATDRILEAEPGAVFRNPQLAQAVASRLRRGAKIPSP